MDKKLLTILVCTLNSVRTIERCLHAVRVEFQDSKIIIVDGGSSDGTLESIKGYSNVEIHIKPELSLAESRMFGFKCASTEFVLQLDSDVILHAGSGKVLCDTIRNADEKTAAIEFGINNYFVQPFPSKNIINNGDYEKRAYYFATIIRPSMLTFKNIKLRHLEEEYARRMLTIDGKIWIKTGEIIGDHYSSPDRYGGETLNVIVRGLPFPNWTFIDEGKLDSATGQSVAFLPLKLVKIVGRVMNYQLLLIWLKSLGNPVSAVTGYLIGRFRSWKN